MHSNQIDFHNIVAQNLVYEVVSGSLSYGTDLASSDLDLRGVFIATPERQIGLSIFDYYKAEKDDAVYNGLAKFLDQCAGGAINMIELLYVRESDVRVLTEDFATFIANRNRFLTIDMLHKTLGFMVGMRRRAECLIAKRAAGKLEDNQAAIIDKQLMHAVRVGRMVSECLTTNTLKVYRPDRIELLLIRNGQQPVDTTLHEIADLINVIEVGSANTGWPDHVDRDKLSKEVAFKTACYWRHRNWV